MSLGPGLRTKRLLVLGMMAVVGVAAAMGALAAIAGPPTLDPSTGTPQYQPGPSSSRPEVEQRPDGTWWSYLLPFAGPFATRESAQRAVDEARRDGLIR